MGFQCFERFSQCYLFFLEFFNVFEKVKEVFFVYLNVLTSFQIFLICFELMFLNVFFKVFFMFSMFLKVPQGF